MLPALQTISMRADVTVPFFTILPQDLHPERLSSWYDLLKHLPLCHPLDGPWIAGGSVRRLLTNYNATRSDEGDVDYFCRDEQQWHTVCDQLVRMGATRMRFTEDHATYRFQTQVVQVIRTRFCESLKAHMSAFDFTLCQTGWGGTHFLISHRAYQDLQSGTIRLTGTPHYPLGSWTRLPKYVQQGFLPDLRDLDVLMHLAAEEQGESVYTSPTDEGLDMLEGI